MEATSDFIKNDYLSLKFEDEKTFLQTQRVTNFYDPIAYHREAQESPQKAPVQHPMPNYSTCYPPLQRFPQSKPVNVKVIRRNNKPPMERPTFSEMEFPRNHKRQKLGEFIQPPNS